MRPPFESGNTLGGGTDDVKADTKWRHADARTATGERDRES
jgi:hypothetical protein